MDAQRIAVDAVVTLTNCDRDTAVACIRRLYLEGVTDPNLVYDLRAKLDGSGHYDDFEVDRVA